jgi:hypothetical protein
MPIKLTDLPQQFQDQAASQIQAHGEKSRRSKYNVAPKDQRTWRGRTYDSKAEMEYAQLLYELFVCGSVKVFIPQPCVQLTEDHAYRPDFFVQWDDGTIDFIDIKGVMTAASKKHVAMWRKYGPCDLVITKKRGDRFFDEMTVEGGRGKDAGERVAIAIIWRKRFSLTLSGPCCTRYR